MAFFSSMIGGRQTGTRVPNWCLGVSPGTSEKLGFGHGSGITADRPVSSSWTVACHGGNVHSATTASAPIASTHDTRIGPFAKVPLIYLGG
jgi:hypothetical protein